MLAVIDIGAVFGRYTYLATEVGFGALAVVLLAYTRAWRRAAVTVATLYPLGFVWDWYTLEIGVFAIPLRTGIMVLGIPLEEHLFIVVIPSLVVGWHELLHGPHGRPPRDWLAAKGLSAWRKEERN